ncbi:MAG: hypothetical protein CBC13_00985 [Planctomycetia bacterium TMED53]|nr:MAG: hypothetical protein CBC13_00985 [Planctomycetia bacterium TMED53]
MPWFAALAALFLFWILLRILDRICRFGGSLNAISGVLIAEVWRRKLLPVSGILLLAGILVLPWILGVDLADASERRTLLQYGQGWIGFVLLVVTMVMCCSTLSEEKSSGRLGFLSLRPGLPIWWLPGKWLGSLGSNLVLLIPASLLLLTQIQNPGSDWGNPATVLPISAQQFSVTEEDVDLFLLLKVEESPLEWGQLSEADAKIRARSYLHRQARSIPLGSSAYLDFKVGDDVREESTSEEALVLSIRPAMGRAHRSQIARILISGEDFETELLVTNGQRSELKIPQRMLLDGGVALEVAFLGAVDEEVRIPSLYWIDEEAVQLLVPMGTLGGSLLRSQLLLLARCAFVAALSLAVSTFLGFPVATLLVFCFLIAATGGGFVGAFEEEGPQTMVDPRQEASSRQVIDLLAQGGERIVRSLGEWEESSTAEQVSAGQFVSWNQVWRGGSILAGLWAGFALIVGTILLSRQEHSTGDQQ